MSESSFTCPGFRASGLAWRLSLIFHMFIFLKLFESKLCRSDPLKKKSVTNPSIVQSLSYHPMEIKSYSKKKR